MLTAGQLLVKRLYNPIGEMKSSKLEWKYDHWPEKRAQHVWLIMTWWFLVLMLGAKRNKTAMKTQESVLKSVPNKTLIWSFARGMCSHKNIAPINRGF